MSEDGGIRRATDSPSRNIKRGELLRPRLGRYGYRRVTLYREAKGTAFHVHRLVALAFVGPAPSPSALVCHIDGTKTNNHYTNLSWGDEASNYEDSRRHGTAAVGERQGHAKLTRRDARGDLAHQARRQLALRRPGTGRAMTARWIAETAWAEFGGVVQRSA